MGATSKLEEAYNLITRMGDGDFGMPFSIAIEVILTMMICGTVSKIDIGISQPSEGRAPI
jgi:hypothetical protein